MAGIETRCCVALSAFCLLSLAGCGGGGGYSTPVSTVVSPAMGHGISDNLQAASTTVTFQAAAVTATGAKWGTANISPSGQGATITLTTDASGNLSGVVIPAGAINSGPTGNSLTDPLTLDFGYQIGDISKIPNEIGYTISQVAAGQGLTASAYGVWVSIGNTLPGNAGTFAFGNLTSPTSVPTTGSATFNGFTIGVGGATNGGAAYSVKGNAQIIANFATQAVTTSLTNFPTSIAGVSIPDLTGTSAMSGNAYTGPISGGGLAGSINGNFYGSGAQETAGVWQASGGGNAWIGSFGAKQ